MLMLERVKVCLFSLVIFALLIIVNIASGIDVDVAICTTSYPWAQDSLRKATPTRRPVDGARHSG